MSKKQFPLRLDPNLYVVLERWAADEFRSVNAHIEYLLRESAKRAGRIPKSTEITDQDE
ncbi:MAG TPA: toxin-antitoxin system HicB family antitoxin [Desulfobacteria bacterium]|nr:toxin-antitoxin system HicB family antitoxin [Desulfobacteria bacterium]